MRSSYESALEVVAGKHGHDEGDNRNTNIHQEEGASMLTTVAEPAEKFDTDIHVGNKTVFAADGSVWAHTELGALEFTPEQACAFAVALQAVAVHVMEQQIEVAA